MKLQQNRNQTSITRERKIKANCFAVLYEQNEKKIKYKTPSKKLNTISSTLV